MKTQQQLEFNFAKPRDCTPQEQKEWINGELKYWADKQGNLIIAISILQVSLIGFMLGMMGIINWLVE